MMFSKKLILLIGACVVVLTGLCFIQYRLVRNTYRLEETVYTQQLIRKLETTQYLSDSINHHAMATLVASVKQQLTKRDTPTIAGLQEQVNVITHPYRQKLAEIHKADSMLSRITYHLWYPEIILFRGDMADTLLSRQDIPLQLTGDTILPDAVIIGLGEGLQQVGFNMDTTVIPSGNIDYRLVVSTKPVINSTQWKRHVIKRVASTLIGSSILILSVVVLFFMVFHTLIRQKRIADITTDFANNITHELKTPLSAAGVIVKSLRTPEARLDENWYNELLHQLNQQHNKIRRMMDSILNTAIGQPWGALQCRQIMLSTILNDAVKMIRDNRRHCILSIQENVSIYTDPDVLTSILSNIIDNALKYTPAKSPIKIYSMIKGKFLQIYIEDQGSGIPPAYQRYLFTKFFRMPKKDDQHVRGLGLGLYLCRMQARQLGGDIAYRQGEQGGSIFLVNLPYDKNSSDISRG